MIKKILIIFVFLASGQGLANLERSENVQKIAEIASKNPDLFGSWPSNGADTGIHWPLELFLVFIGIVALFLIFSNDADTSKRRADREKARLEEEKLQKKEEEKARLEEERIIIEKKKLDNFLIGLHHSLPFYTRNDSQKYSQYNGDDFRWSNILKTIKSNDTTETSLYLVKVKDLDSGDEHYKVGTTAQEVPNRFLKSPDLELIEVLYEFKMDARFALFAEFHFIREFRATDNPEGIEKSSVVLDGIPEEPKKRFSGYTEVVKDNSVKKILALMRNLPEYVARADDLLTKKLTDKDIEDIKKEVYQAEKQRSKKDSKNSPNPFGKEEFSDIMKDIFE